MANDKTGRTPVTLVCGIDEVGLTLAGHAVQLALPRSVSLRFELDPDDAWIRRVIADGGGVLEDERVPLETECLHCAARQEIVPALLGLADRGRWDAIVVHLPRAFSPVPLARAVAHTTSAGRKSGEHLSVSAVVCAVRGADVQRDVFGDDLLVERDESFGADGRSVGEVLAQMVEYADVITVVDEQLDSRGRAILDELRQPGSQVVTDVSGLVAADLVDRPRCPETVDRWVDPTARSPFSGDRDSFVDQVHEVSTSPQSGVWTLFIDTWRPFHPERLMENIERIGGGPVRGRGCFWLPTRPDAIAAWDGAGGQLSVGTVGSWGDRMPRTRLVVTGIGEGLVETAESLEATLATDAELARGRDAWCHVPDGFEPWLGAYGDSA